MINIFNEGTKTLKPARHQVLYSLLRIYGIQLRLSAGLCKVFLGVVTEHTYFYDPEAIQLLPDLNQLQ
jgi:hypothetical protein